MARPKTPAPFPSRHDIIRFIEDSPGKVGKREIARAFNLDADQKLLLKKELRALEADGVLLRGRGKQLAKPGTLPEVTIIVITSVTEDGDLLARPDIWDHEDTPPRIEVGPERRGQAALGPGDKVLARMEKRGRGYFAKPIKKLAAAPASILGVYRVAPDSSTSGGGRIEPTDKRVKSDFAVHPGDSLNAENGELVRADIMPGRRLGLKRAKVVERLGGYDNPKAVSLISIYEQDIPLDFPEAALKQAEKAKAAPLGNREDLRQTPLVTIDGADARDFDDAVFAEADADPKNPGGWHLIVAIADVAWYVRQDDPLDREAYKRGNSVYFPDRVVPMLPEALSNGWCSLRPKEERPCLAVHMWIDRNGNLLRHKFVRGLMFSAARLTYEQAQRAYEGEVDEVTEMLIDPVIKPLYGAYHALQKARDARETLDLDLPERQVHVNDDGRVEAITIRERLDSHKLIEEFMVTANVAAAEALEAKTMPAMYRIHDQPSREKLETLSDFLETLDLNLAKGQVPNPRQFNGILRRAQDTPHAAMVNTMVLRSQSQAEYNPDNIGHFGLALHRYCHFTSPIRRYSDLLVHRALITGYRLGQGGLPKELPDFAVMGEQISKTERRAQVAERNAVDRYTAAYLSDKEGAVFEATIAGVQRFGLFVQLTETGADGLVPVRSLPDDYYLHDEVGQRLVGERTGYVFRLGEPVEVCLLEARPVSGGLIFELLAGGSQEKSGKRRLKKGTQKRGGPKRSHKKSGHRRSRRSI